MVKIKPYNIALTAFGLYLLLRPKKATGISNIDPGSDQFITRHFTWNEFYHNGIAADLDIADQYNAPQSAKDAARRLAQTVLEPLRADLGGAVHVNNWYRSQATVDAMIDAGYAASRNSTHMTGGTVDIEFGNGSTDNALIIRSALSMNLPFDRILIEKGTIEAPGYIHLEQNPDETLEDQRRQIWVITKGTTGYMLSPVDADKIFL